MKFPYLDYQSCFTVPDQEFVSFSTSVTFDTEYKNGFCNPRKTIMWCECIRAEQIQSVIIT